jgi:GntR family transcriptional regulator
MFDIQHDSAVPVAEQITGQIRAQVASGALKAGAALAEHRALAKELLTNPQVVARAYGELEREGVLKKDVTGTVEVTAAAAELCRQHLRDLARTRIREAVAFGLANGLPEVEIVQAVADELAVVRGQPVGVDEVLKAIKNPKHEFSYRNNQGIQDLSRKSRPGST